ncbi:MAG: GNAT family N-acetyltransferase [Planctomycetota bacterium]|nr:GNAT family N-acetyltransferase [Planctomycetota bacterium]
MTTTSIATGKLALEILGSTERERALTIWRQLESQRPLSRLACSSDWTRIWLDHYGDAIQHRFIIAKQLETPVGVVLVTHGVDQFDGPFRIQTRHLGTAGEPDSDSVCVEYNDIMVQPEHRDAFFALLLNHIRRERAWDQLCLDGFARDDLPSMIRSPDFTPRAFESMYFDLRKARDSAVEPLALLGKSTKKSIRRTRNAIGNIHVEWADDVVSALDCFEELVELHQARWQSQGKPGVYASKRFAGFHRDLISELVESGRIALVRVVGNGTTIGCGQYLVERRRLLFYQGGWAQLGHNINPGLLFHYECIEAAMQRGYDAYDFMKGGARYKQSLSTDSETLVWAQHRRPRLKFLATRLARHLKAMCFKRSLESTGRQGHIQ